MADTLEQRFTTAADELPYALTLELTVEDREVIRALCEHAEGAGREEFALDALKIGVVALRHAAGAMDADFIQRETTRLVECVRRELDQQARVAHDRLAGSLKEFFDPESGRFNQRVRQLTDEGGELAQMMRGMFDGDDSRLAKTMLAQVGQNSPLMKILSPDQSEGLLATLRRNVEASLADQREKILGEFSLNNRDGALTRLVHELKTKHGDLSKDLQEKIDDVMKAFSLDDEQSALSRLVSRVDKAQQKITDEFQLENESSSLSKLKKELLTILSAQVDSSSKFQEEVKVALAKLVTKRETEERGTLHGKTFQDAAMEFVMRDAHRRGDVADDTGDRVGQIKNCKVGDAVVTLGADHAAAGACFVLEAKQDRSYTLARAHTELEQARKNRGAQVGIFVFSSRTAPANLGPLFRQGSDLFVVWDAEDPHTDAYFVAALEIARALCIRASQRDEQRQLDLSSLDDAVLDIEKRAANLDDIRTSAETISNSSAKILKRVRIDKVALEKQVALLREASADIKAAVGRMTNDE